MTRLTRRDFLKLGTAGAALLMAGGNWNSLARAMELAEGGRSPSNTANKTRGRIPSSCLQCVAVCGIVGFVENGRLVKIEGNPEHPNSRGRLCARGQAGINQVYDPERILYPFKRAGKRGEGKWIRVSWEEALDEVASKLREVRESGKPEEFMFHYGRNRASWTTTRFTDGFGTKTVAGHTAICETAKWVAQELTWGVSYDVNDVANSKYILNFGSNIYEAHTSHNYFLQRLIDGRVENGAKLVTFDVRLSHTAGRSDEWFPVKPGTDGLVALAMANVIMQEGLYDAEFINTWTNTSVERLKEHLKQYTPEFAETESGVPALAIHRIAVEFATNRPSTVVSYRGAVAHYNGVQNERAIKLLDAIVGNIDVKGGTCLKKSGKWADPFPMPPGAKRSLKIVDGENIAYPTHHVDQMVFDMIRSGKAGRPKVYMMYVYNPAYANGDLQRVIEVLKDESLIPYIVAIDSYMSESTALADIILPDATYLERWDPEAPQSYDMIEFVALRQPVVEPLGEARPFQDVAIELAKRIGGGMDQWFPYRNSEEYIRRCADETKGLGKAGGFEYLKEHGVFTQNPKPKYKTYEQEPTAAELEGTSVDPVTGTIYRGSKYEGKNNYVGMMINGKAYRGFKPDKLPISGKLELYSKLLADKGFAPLPSYVPIPEHRSMGESDLILTTYKVNVHTQSRTANCKWLMELSHDNRLLIHPDAARARRIQNDDLVKVRSSVGEIVVRTRITQGIHPRVVALSHHLGHWEYGKIARGGGPFESNDPDTRLIWWRYAGVHPNWIVPNSPEPVSGQQRWYDTVVRVDRA
ncbi:MAG: molybdopterin-dependent oxidoreductase [Firmicutes bacterium]|nr:molybdopterin-dependent oxidoreductase [Bacillota bacterium]